MTTGGASQLGALHYNALAKDRAPEGADQATWHMDRCRELLARLIDTSFDTQFPTDGLTKALADPVCVEAFISFITRDPTPIGEVEEDFMDRRYLKTHTFTTAVTVQEEDELDLKRAYRTANVLYSLAEYPTAVLAQVCAAKSETILSPLFRAFRTENSKASVYHLCRALEGMVRLCPNRVVDYMVEGQRLKLCMVSLIGNLQCSVVVDLLVNLMRMPLARDPNAGMERLRLISKLNPEQRKHFQRRLTLVDPVQLLLNNIPGDAAEGSCEVISQLLQHFELKIVATMSNELAATEQVLKPLAEQQTVDKLVKLAIEGNIPAFTLLSQLARLAATGRVNAALINTPQPNDDEDEDLHPSRRKPTNIKAARAAAKTLASQQQAERDAQSKLSKLRLDLKQVLTGNTKYLALLCAALEREEDSSLQQQGAQKHTSYVCATSFSFHRLELLRTVAYIVEMLVSDKQQQPPPALTVLPWKHLVRWQSAYPHNSLLQHEFTRLVQFTLVHREDDMKQALVEHKLVSQLIRRAKENDTDHAHVLQCLNLLRLKHDLLIRVLSAKLQHKHWFVQYLKSHSAWTAFLPELKSTTQRSMLFASPNEPSNGAAAALHDLFQFDSSNPLTQGAMDTASQLAEEERRDVELGSEFARCLGFTPALISAAAQRALAADEDWLDEPATSSSSTKKKPGNNQKKGHNGNHTSQVGSSAKKKKKA